MICLSFDAKRGPGSRVLPNQGALVLYTLFLPIFRPFKKPVTACTCVCASRAVCSLTRDSRCSTNRGGVEGPPDRSVIFFHPSFPTFSSPPIYTIKDARVGARTPLIALCHSPPWPLLGRLRNSGVSSIDWIIAV